MSPEVPSNQRDVKTRLQRLLKIKPGEKKKLKRAMDIYLHFEEYLLRYEDNDALSLEDCAIIEQILKTFPEFEEKRKEHEEVASFLNGLGKKVDFLSFYKEIDDCLYGAGSADIDTAVSSLSTFLNQKEISEEKVRQFIEYLLQEDNISTNAQDEIAGILERDNSAFHITCSDLLLDANDHQETKPLDAVVVRKWLEYDHTKFYSLVYTEHRKIWIVLVDFDEVGTGYGYSSMWCKVDPSDHFIILSSRLSPEKRIGAIRNECRRMLEESFGCSCIDDSAYQEEGGTFSDRPTNIQNNDLTHTKIQLRSNEEGKRQAGRWLIQELRISADATLAIDAGTGPAFFIDELFKDIANKFYCPNCNILTNNLLVFELWKKYKNIPQIQSGGLNLLGSRYDANHEALFQSDWDGGIYPNLCKSKSLNVLDCIIGSSGLMIEKGGLYMSINALGEKESKAFFWKVPAKRKIVLLTPSKIGVPRGREKYNVFKLKDIYQSAPIVMISSSPQNQKEEKHLEEVRNLFKEQVFCQNAKEMQLTIHLIIIGEQSLSNKAGDPNEKRLKTVIHDVVSPKTYDLLAAISKYKKESKSKKKCENELKLDEEEQRKSLFEIV